jgi:hypothetical protein
MSKELDNRLKNKVLVNYVVLPFLFLTVVLQGGLRVSGDDRAFMFFAPSLISLILAALLLILFVRGRLIDVQALISGGNTPLVNVSHVWLIVVLFFASAQAFNSVLPERGLLNWLFSFFFLWTLWNNQFSSFDARRLLRSLVVLFGTAFILKHVLIASINSSDGGWLKSLTSTLVSSVTLGALDSNQFAPATGYISFFTLCLYLVGLVLLGFNQQTPGATTTLIVSHADLDSADRQAIQT